MRFTVVVTIILAVFTLYSYIIVFFEILYKKRSGEKINGKLNLLEASIASSGVFLISILVYILLKIINYL